MGHGNITEVLRELEGSFLSKKLILKHYQETTGLKKEVDTIISNEGLSLNVQDSGSGNIWSKVDNLEQNIVKLDKEISLYEGLLNKSRPRMR